MKHLSKYHPTEISIYFFIYAVSFPRLVEFALPRGKRNTIQVIIITAKRNDHVVTKLRGQTKHMCVRYAQSLRRISRDYAVFCASLWEYRKALVVVVGPFPLPAPWFSLSPSPLPLGHRRRALARRCRDVAIMYTPRQEIKIKAIKYLN